MRFTGCVTRSRSYSFKNANRDELKKRMADMSTFLKKAIHRSYQIRRTAYPAID